MRRFFTDKKLTVGTEIVLDGEEAKHIMTVLRMKPGDELLLINGTGREMTARILNENKGEVRLEAWMRTESLSPSIFFREIRTNRSLSNRWKQK